MFRNIQDQQERGQDLVEFALLLPVLLLILLGIVEFGIAIFSYDTMANVSREVARFAIVHPETAAIDDYIENNMNRWTSGMNTDVLSVTVSLQDGTYRDQVNVVVGYEYKLLTGPIIRAAGGNSTITMQTQSTMYSE